jgi:hypothetical protein
MKLARYWLAYKAFAEIWTIVSLLQNRGFIAL